MTHGRRLGAVRRRLLDWYARARRDLPWRRTDDPYAIWVAEAMLQQTRVETVIPYFDRFLRRFPSVARLASASEEQVLAAWSGLGYYRRARALREGARAVVARHDGKVPDDPALLRELPGIGRYTAGAIASIAFGRAEPIVDGNVRRVLSRLSGIDGTALGRAAEERRLWSIAERLVRGPRPGDLNQALMELGACVCTPREPGCARCPVRSLCVARRSGRPEEVPAPRPRRPTETATAGVAWVERAGRVLVERPGGESPLRGSWDLPAAWVGSGQAPQSVLTEALQSRYGLEVRAAPPAFRARHGILHLRLMLEVCSCRWLRGKIAGRTDLRWIDPSRLDEQAVSGATRKIAGRAR